MLQNEDFVAIVDMEIDPGTQVHPLALCYPIPLINKLLNSDGSIAISVTAILWTLFDELKLQ